jgi:hypothetical protein
VSAERTQARADAKPKLCPSAQPDMDGAVAFGIVEGTAEEPRVTYLRNPLPVTDELLELAKPVEPTEVFRFAAPCAESGCQHFDGASCQLGRKVAENVPVTIAGRLPACRIRPSCRWFAERGPAACARCPLIVTTDYRPTEALRQAADPAVVAST